jgi:PAS domain S-box-containing protein
MKRDVLIPETRNVDKAIIRTNIEGIITDWSLNAEKLLGFSSEEIVGQNISKIIPMDYITEGKNNTNNKMEHMEDTFYEVNVQTKFNENILVGIEQSSIKNGNGIITGFSKTLHHISEDNKNEEKQAIIEAIIKSSDEGIISRTLEGIITSWNPAASRIFGYTDQEVIGKHISVIIPADRLDEDNLIIDQIKEGHKIEHFETVRLAKDGSEKDIDLSISPVKSKDGQVIGIAQIFRDTSFQKDIEEKKAILAAIVDSSDDAIISKTINGIITSWNKSATTMFGYSEEEAIGQHISIIIPPERIDEETVIIENIRKGNKVDHFETERVSKDGTKKNISVTVSPIKDNKGIIVGASKTARDISTKMEAEKKQELYTKRLQELNQYKDEFMVMASHELKTPVTVILANLQILKLLLEGDTHSAFVEKTLKQVLKLSSLIGNLFEVSKIQAGKLVLNLTTFDLNNIIKEVAENLQQTTLNHRILYNENPGIMVTADNSKIEQVIVNLVNNAIKYMTQPGDIHINLEKTANNVIFKVSDQGVGIPPKDIENIFQRFYRVSGSASSFSGSGVGLYISSEIIKGHHGKIWAESEFGKGSTFYFSLPCPDV